MSRKRPSRAWTKGLKRPSDAWVKDAVAKFAKEVQPGLEQLADLKELLLGHESRIADPIGSIACPPGQRRHVYRNEERDRFIFEAAERQLQDKEIRHEIKKHSGWAQIGTDQGVNNALRRYGARNGIDNPRYEKSQSKHD
jgi:hypothetical protein